MGQIQEETVNDYLDKTVMVGETLAETQARRRAFLDGMNAGTFLLMPGGGVAGCRLRWKLVFDWIQLRHSPWHSQWTKGKTVGSEAKKDKLETAMLL